MSAQLPLIQVENLVKHFPVRAGFLKRAVAWVHAVDGISFDVQSGQTLSLVGESGCGKSTTAKLLLRLEEPTSGRILWQGRDLATLDGEGRRQYRSSVQPVFQDPWSSLSPRMRCEDIIAEPLQVNRKDLSRKQIRERVNEVLEQVGLRPWHAKMYPHEFSGGQRQRIAVARALSLQPSIMILDEPVSALDVSIRAQIMNLAKTLQKELGLTYVLIAHDFGTVRYMSDWVAVMYLGEIVEHSPSRQLFARPLHPYTQALLSAAVAARPGEKEEFIVGGEVPSPINPPAGCRFHTRCPFVMEHCRTRVTQLRELVTGHRVACFLYHTPDGELTDTGKEVAQEASQLLSGSHAGGKARGDGSHTGDTPQKAEGNVSQAGEGSPT